MIRGKDSLSISLRMASSGAPGGTLFVFGLIAFLYVYITVYVLEAASVDLFLFTILQELTKGR